MRERAAREQVEEAENGSALVAEVVVDRLGIDSGRREPGTEAVQRDDHCGEKNPAPQLRDAPRVRQPGEHAVLALAFRLLLVAGRLTELGGGVLRCGLRTELPRFLSPLRLAEHGDAAAGGFDLLAGDRRDRVGDDRQLRTQLAVAE